MDAWQREEQVCEYLDRKEKKKIIPVSKPSFPASLFRNQYLCSIACPHAELLSVVERGGNGALKMSLT